MTVISWTVTADPFKLQLVPSPASPVGAGLTSEPFIAAGDVGADGTFRVEIFGQIFDIAIEKNANGAPLAALVVLDDDAPDRILALQRFWSASRGQKTRPDERLTTARRHRLRGMLRAVDAHRDGATYREIGETLFERHSIDPKSWVGDSIRETTIRLVRDGLKLVRGGYRDLLRRSRRSPP